MGKLPTAFCKPLKIEIHKDDYAIEQKEDKRSLQRWEYKNGESAKLHLIKDRQIKEKQRHGKRNRKNLYQLRLYGVNFSL